MANHRLNSKQSLLVEYLKTHDSISSIEAFELFKITRLAASIYLLKNQGYNITVEYIANEKYGRYAIYRLED